MEANSRARLGRPRCGLYAGETSLTLQSSRQGLGTRPKKRRGRNRGTWRSEAGTVASTRLSGREAWPGSSRLQQQSLPSLAIARHWPIRQPVDPPGSLPRDRSGEVRQEDAARAAQSRQRQSPAAPDAWRPGLCGRCHGKAAHLMLVDQPADKSGCFHLGNEVAQVFGSLCIPARRSNRLLHGRELAIEDTRAG